MSTCHPVILPFCHPVILSSCHPVILSSCHPVILSSWSSWSSWSSCQSVILSSCHQVIQSNHYVLCCHYCLILINPPSVCIVFKPKVSSALYISHLATNKYQEGKLKLPCARATPFHQVVMELEVCERCLIQ